MKNHKEKVKMVLDDILCDICNTSTKCEGKILAGSLIGVFSNKTYDIDICESCFNKTLAMLRSFRRQNSVNTKNNPLEGEKI